MITVSTGTTTLGSPNALSAVGLSPARTVFRALLFKCPRSRSMASPGSGAGPPAEATGTAGTIDFLRGAAGRLQNPAPPPHTAAGHTHRFTDDGPDPGGNRRRDRFLCEHASAPNPGFRGPILSGTPRPHARNGVGSLFTSGFAVEKLVAELHPERATNETPFIRIIFRIQTLVHQRSFPADYR